jgi:hypothetical protein
MKPYEPYCPYCHIPLTEPLGNHCRVGRCPEVGRVEVILLDNNMQHPITSPETDHHIGGIIVLQMCYSVWARTSYPGSGAMPALSGDPT